MIFNLFKFCKLDFLQKKWNRGFGCWLLVAGCWNKGNQNIQIIFNDEKSLIGTETKRAEVVLKI